MCGKAERENKNTIDNIITKFKKCKDDSHEMGFLSIENSAHG
jgi:hypothetical protein